MNGWSGLSNGKFRDWGGAGARGVVGGGRGEGHGGRGIWGLRESARVRSKGTYAYALPTLSRNAVVCVL